MYVNIINQPFQKVYFAKRLMEMLKHGRSLFYCFITRKTGIFFGSYGFTSQLYQKKMSFFLEINFQGEKVAEIFSDRQKDGFEHEREDTAP